MTEKNDWLQKLISSATQPLIIAPLQINEVHVFAASLNRSQEEISARREILIEPELTRAARFYKEEHRTRFVVTRSLLRQLLAGYLAAKDPSKILLHETKFGKLFIEQECTGMCKMRLQFNVSHSNELALFAFTLQHSVGVDVEFMRDDAELEGVARKFFAPEEVKDFFSAPLNERMQAFFRCWTRKEAFIKALGEGLSYPLKNFAVDLLTAGEGEIPLTIHDATQAIHPWHLFALCPAPNYVGALAVKGIVNRILLYQSV